MSLRLFFFRFALALLIIAAMEAIGYCGLWLNSRSNDILFKKNYFRIRDMLLGNNDPELLPRYLSQPYLGYIPYPGYAKSGIRQHNEDGYRGNRVSLQKTDKFRIICLGGSTTYGFAVDSPSQAFPAQLELLLNKHIADDTALSKEFKGAEVINAGIEAGNSAEELQQYLFKYRYYSPDLVIAHSGVNDALLCSIAQPDFQLDYTHYRRMILNLEPLPSPARHLLKSYFFSFIAIRLFYNDFSGFTHDEFQHQGRQTFCKWSTVSLDSALQAKQYSYYPFYQNTKNLYAAIRGDSAMFITLPNILNKNSEMASPETKYHQLAQLNVTLTRALADTFGGIFVPFNFYSIADTLCWVDDCHINAKGEREKAKFLLPYVTQVMKQHVERETKLE